MYLRQFLMFNCILKGYFSSLRTVVKGYDTHYVFVEDNFFSIEARATQKSNDSDRSAINVVMIGNRFINNAYDIHRRSLSLYIRYVGFRALTKTPSVSIRK